MLGMYIGTKLSASRLTPRFFTDRAGSMVLPSRLKGNDEFLVQSSPIKINSILLGFNLSLLLQSTPGYLQTSLPVL